MRPRRLREPARATTATLLHVPWCRARSLRVAAPEFAEYARVLGSSLIGDIGEAATLAWAETHAAVAIVDDRAARNVARLRGVTVHGSLWLVTRGMNEGHLREPAATRLVGMLLETDARFPFTSAAEFIPWARAESLID